MHLTVASQSSRVQIHSNMPEEIHLERLLPHDTLDTWFFNLA